MHRLMRSINTEHRYGRRVVQLVEQFELSVVAFRGSLLQGPIMYCRQDLIPYFFSFHAFSLFYV